MTPEAIALALFNAGRPAGIAAVYALLCSPRPQRVLAVFIAVGFTWSLSIGVIIVSGFDGFEIGGGNSVVNDVIDLLGGVALLGFSAGLALGRIGNRDTSRERMPSTTEALERRLRDPSLALAAGAGILTHLPGLFYLLGLNAIVETQPGFAGGVIEVLVFNLIWFAPPTAALVISIRRPEEAQQFIGRISAIGRRHARTIVITLSALVGAYFAVNGALELLG